MEAVLILAAVVVVALVLFVLWQVRRLSRIKGMAQIWERYIDLRRQYVSDPRVGSNRAFVGAADGIVAEVGPKYDPRVSGWVRLGMLEPNLRAFVTQYADPSTEEPLDLEAFAESILRLDMVQFRGITEGDWLHTARLFATWASEWRMTQLGVHRASLSPTEDEAMAEAVAVASRIFKFAEWHWDRKRNMAVDRMGRPAPSVIAQAKSSPIEHPAPRLATFIEDVGVGIHSNWVRVQLEMVNRGPADSARYKTARERVQELAQRPEHRDAVAAAQATADERARRVYVPAMVEMSGMQPGFEETGQPRIFMCGEVTKWAAAGLVLEGYLAPEDIDALLLPFAGITEVAP